ATIDPAAPLDDLAPLARMVGDAKVVGLGEFARRPGGPGNGRHGTGRHGSGGHGSGGHGSGGAGSAGRASVPMAELAGLSEREREVLLLIARGRTNDQIAEHLGISRVTVKTHIRRLLAKLDAHDRAQLVVVAYESGLVTPGH
ncbi:helix-turn-helix transcriptional regulator, partial [Nonomuraea sp. NPDC055795]